VKTSPPWGSEHLSTIVDRRTYCTTFVFEKTGCLLRTRNLMDWLSIPNFRIEASHMIIGKFPWYTLSVLRRLGAVLACQYCRI
jgi:hypothetical protein